MKLHAFGCSNTYGHYLPNRETNTWPWNLGQIIGCPVENHGVCGASNDLILRKLLEADLDDDSLVIIVWSFESRIEIVTDDGQFCNIIPNYADERSEVKHYYGYIQNEHYDSWRLTNNLHHAQSYLKSLNIPYVMSFVSFEISESANSKLFNCSIDRSKFFAERESLLQELKQQYPVMQGGHPGAQAYRDYANKLYDWMLDNNYNLT